MTTSVQLWNSSTEAWESLSLRKISLMLRSQDPEVQSWLHSQLLKLNNKELRVSRLNES